MDKPMVRAKRSENAVEGAAHPRRGGRLKAILGESEQTGVHLVSPGDLNITLEPIVPGTGGDFSSDFVARSLEQLDRGLAAQMSPPLQLEQALQRHPAEQSRVRMRDGSRARLPDSMVGIAPVPADVESNFSQESGRLCVKASTRADELDCRLDDLAIDIELQLRLRRISHPHRP